MKILVLGSNGLVGSSLIRVLGKNKKYNIHPSTRKDTNLFIKEETEKLINSVKPNLIINAAAKVGGIVANNTNRTEFILENLKININLLESIIPHNEIKLINLGSSCIYPLDSPNPINEENLMNGKLEPTNSPYAMAKLTAIEMGDALSQQYGHSIINLMPTNLYGPNDNFSETSSHVIPGLIRRLTIAKHNKDEVFKVWGTGTPKREFLHVDDLSDAIKFLIENNKIPKLINVGSGKEVTIKKLVSLLVDITSYKGEVVYDSSMPDGNPRKLLDSSKLNEMGWNSSIDLDTGLENTYKWFMENEFKL